MRISDWSSDVCSSDLTDAERLDLLAELQQHGERYDRAQRQAVRPALGAAFVQRPIRKRAADRQRRHRHHQPRLDHLRVLDSLPESGPAPSRFRINRNRHQKTHDGFIRNRFGATRSADGERSEEHTSELQSLMSTSYAVFCLKKKTHTKEK